MQDRISSFRHLFSYLTFKNALKAFVVINGVLKASAGRLSAFDSLDASGRELVQVPLYAADPSQWAAIAAAHKPDISALGAAQRRPLSRRRMQHRRGLSGGPTSSAYASRQKTGMSALPPSTAPGVMPPAGINGPAGAWEIPGLGRRKQLLREACLANQISDVHTRAQILAAALIEGDLSCNTDPDKSGLAATYGVFNLNRGMIRDLGLGRLEATIQKVDALPASLQASVQVIDAAIKKYGVEGFKLWQRGGQTLKDDPAGQAERYLWSSYSAAFDNTVAYLTSGSGLTDDYRYAEKVPAV